VTERLDADLRQGAKAAAAAAAVGAAVGVARAIASRAEHAAQREDAPPETQPPVEEPEQTEEPGEPATVEPVRGEGTDRLRGLTERARELLHQLSGAEVESVSALDRNGDGWRVTLEAVELRRIPDSTDVLATYEVELDGDGDLVRYERRRRYSRSQSDHGGGR
jgi:hypothetical protein